MRKFLVLFAFLTLVSCTACTTLRPKEQTTLIDKDASLRLEIEDKNICSGTLIYHNVILTASHCFTQQEKTVKVNGVIVNITKMIDDSNDHMLLVVHAHNQKYARFGPKPKEGDDIYYWGNPLKSPLFRKGYVSGNIANVTLYDVNGMSGDSGAGIFKDKRLIGMISIIHRVLDFRLMGSFPMNFTKTQLTEAGLPLDDPFLVAQLTEGHPSKNHK